MADKESSKKHASNKMVEKQQVATTPTDNAKAPSNEAISQIASKKLKNEASKAALASQHENILHVVDFVELHGHGEGGAGVATRDSERRRGIARGHHRPHRGSVAQQR